MIVCHRYRFIFLKTSKTAGTSVEIALSRYCGPGDIVTSFSSADETTRSTLQYQGPANEEIPLLAYGPDDWRRLLFNHKRKKYFNHASAEYVRRYLARKTWREYFKFTVERNPFDKAVSRYYWSTRNNTPRPPIVDYLSIASPRKLSNWHIYTIDNEIAVDRVIRYENLQSELDDLRQLLHLPGRLQLPMSKSGYRAAKEHYSKTLPKRGRQIIESVCRRELAAFGYAWEEPLDRAI